VRRPESSLNCNIRSICMEAFFWCSVVQSFAGSGIEFGSNDIAVMLGERIHVNALGDVLADEAIGVFVGSAFPGMVWGGEVELQLQCLLDERIAVKLRSIVGGDGSELIGVAPCNTQRSSIELLHRSGLELADEHVAGLALHQTHDAVLAAFADHGVDLPVAELAASLHARGSLGDVPFAG